jgi:WD40 repeat protein
MINAYEIPSMAPSDTATSLHPDYTLLGHDDNVCALDVYASTNGYIVSGSWDRTARIWKNWECIAILAGHTQAVWAVLALTDDLVLTGEHSRFVLVVVSVLKHASLLLGSLCRQNDPTLFHSKGSQSRQRKYTNCYFCWT